MEDADEWARQQLMIDGSDLLGKLHVPEVFFLYIASTLEAYSFSALHFSLSFSII